MMDNNATNINKRHLKIPKGVTGIRKSKDRQPNGQKKKKEGTAIYKNLTKKAKDRATGTLLKTGGELRCSGRVSSSQSSC